jgi:DNA-binding transcriptional regulator YiaG
MDIMEETKIVTEYIDTGYGFPVTIYNVPMTKVRGEWLPKINYVRLANAVLKSLCQKEAFLTGNEIRFIRNQLEMTLDEFGKRFDVSHQAVMKWEDMKNNPTKMKWSTEKDIRLFIYKKLFENGFSTLYDSLEQKPISSENKNHEIDINHLGGLSL